MNYFLHISLVLTEGLISKKKPRGQRCSFQDQVSPKDEVFYRLINWLLTGFLVSSRNVEPGLK